MHTLTNSVPHNAAFHQGLHLLLGQENDFQRKKYNFFKGNFNCDPSIYTIMDYPKFIVSNQKEESISA